MELNQILQKLHIEQLNEMQQTVLDQFKNDQDFMLLSPTGSGKTLAFSLLVLQLLEPIKSTLQTLIVVPTRELALQIEQVLKKVIVGEKIMCIYGGHSTYEERKSLRNPATVIIGTPGRIIYHAERDHIDLSTVKTLVLDEFDKSLELGFQGQMSEIIEQLTGVKNKILTSATAMDELPEFTQIKNYVQVDFLKNNQALPQITIKKVIAPAQKKLDALFNLLCKIGEKKVLIFCNHRDAVDHISELLDNREMIHDIFHGGLEQEDRELALLKFRNNSNQILLTTDLAARGLDIPEVDAIIHYQLPYKEDAFIHRNGRTARMQAKGEVYVILKPEEEYSYISADTQEEDLSGEYAIPDNSPFATVYLTAGKKDKINKIDIVGAILKINGIEKEDLGLIEVKDKSAYIAVKRKLVPLILKEKDFKIKGKKVKVYRS